MFGNAGRQRHGAQMSILSEKPSPYPHSAKAAAHPIVSSEHRRLPAASKTGTPECVIAVLRIG